jgi:hypothetical protein
MCVCLYWLVSELLHRDESFYLNFEPCVGTQDAEEEGDETKPVKSSEDTFGSTYVCLPETVLFVEYISIARARVCVCVCVCVWFGVLF